MLPVASAMPVSAGGVCVVNVAIPHWRGRWLPSMASLFIFTAWRRLDEQVFVRHVSTWRSDGAANANDRRRAARRGLFTLEQPQRREAASIPYTDGARATGGIDASTADEQ